MEATMFNLSAGGGKAEMRTIIIGVALWAAIPVTGAQAAMILGNGSISCGEWTKERQKHRAVTVSDEAWLAGYLSGYSVYDGGDVINKDLDRGARAAWVSNYCLNHPLDSISIAADELILELKRRASRR
jgi:hypothetical protein